MAWFALLYIRASSIIDWGERSIRPLAGKNHYFLHHAGFDRKLIFGKTLPPLLRLPVTGWQTLRLHRVSADS
jgi:hypothetical protein